MNRSAFALVLAAVASLCVLWSPPSEAEGDISFARQVKPILDTKCVSCHACYESPAQLDLRNARGIERGAMKIEPYEIRTKAVLPTILWTSPNTTADWRRLGFFSVTEGGRDSLMGKMLTLARRQPVQANAPLARDIEFNQVKRRNQMPTLDEFDRYAADHPHEGMPLGTTGLTDREYETMMAWLEQGAPFDEVAPRPTAKERAKIAEWERFLNAPDDRSRLVARYMYEHMNLFHLYFDGNGQGNFFQLVRSSTPRGQEPLPVEARSVNAPVDGPVYYRMKIVDQTLCAKQHSLLLDASGNKLDRYKRIFSETDWTVDKLPGYSTAERSDPLNTFAAIPAKARWKYLLADVRLHRATILYGPSCFGQLSVGVVQEVEWDFFEDPETSLYVNDAQYRAELAPYLGLTRQPEKLTDYVSNLKEFVEHRSVVLAKSMSRVADGRGNHSALTDIWRGDEPGDTPIVVNFRNADNAAVGPPNVAVGDFPKTAGIFDLPVLERAIYVATVQYDQFGSMANWAANREGFGMSRREWELNFLRFLPEDKRRPIFESWYLAPHPEVHPDKPMLSEALAGEIQGIDFPKLRPGVTLPAQIQFKTDDPKREFLAMLLTHVGDRVRTADPINRPQPGDDPDRVTKAMRSIVAAAAEQQPTWRKFKTMLPEASFLRIDATGRESTVYTMTLDRDFRTKSFVSNLLQDDVPSLAKVTIFPGILTAYPNFMFRIDEHDVDRFATALVEADTPEKFTAVVERWGVRRSSPQFWDVLHSITAYVRRTDPPSAAVFDVNRYANL